MDETVKRRGRPAVKADKSRPVNGKPLAGKPVRAKAASVPKGPSVSTTAITATLAAAEPVKAPAQPVKAAPPPAAAAKPPASPKVEAKPETKPEPKVELKPEPKIVAKVEAKPEPKVEPKVEAKPEPKVAAKVEPKPERKPEPAPVPAKAATPVAPAPVASVTPAPAPVASLPLPLPPRPDVAVKPVAMALETGAAQARTAYAKAHETGEQIRHALAESSEAAARGFVDLNGAVLDLMRAQSDAVLAAWKATVTAPSFSEAIKAQTSGARATYETAATHWKDLAFTANRVVGEVTAPVRALTGTTAR